MKVLHSTGEKSFSSYLHCCHCFFLHSVTLCPPVECLGMCIPVCRVFPSVNSRIPSISDMHLTGGEIYFLLTYFIVSDMLSGLVRRFVIMTLQYTAEVDFWIYWSFHYRRISFEVPVIGTVFCHLASVHCHVEFDCQDFLLHSKAFLSAFSFVFSKWSSVVLGSGDWFGQWGTSQFFAIILMLLSTVTSSMNSSDPVSLADITQQNASREVILTSFGNNHCVGSCCSLDWPYN